MDQIGTYETEDLLNSPNENSYFPSHYHANKGVW